MSTRTHQFEEGVYYSIHNRGNSKQDIFKDEDDYRMFQSILYVMNTEKRITVRQVSKAPFEYEHEEGEALVRIVAYTLLPNHFHIILTTTQEKGISTFMLKVSTAYAMYFNHKYDRTGTLFEGRYKSRPLHTDRDIKECFAYIHLNHLTLTRVDWKDAIRKKSYPGEDAIFSYPYSSASYYRGDGEEREVIVDSNTSPLYTRPENVSLAHLFEWVLYEV